MGYTSLVVKGIGWMGSLQGIFRLLTLLKFIIIVRLLDPAQLGLFGLVMLMVSFFESISDFGLSLFLIQTSKEEGGFINAVWMVSIIRGLLLSLLLLTVSYPVAVFFNVPDSISLFLIASLIPFVKSFVNPSIAKFQKNLHFYKEFLYRVSIITIEVASSIIFVLTLRSPIALIYSLLFSSIVDVLVSLLIIRPIPRFVFETEKIKEIVNFGKWISLIGTTNFFANQLDSIMVGKILGTSDLGIYQMAQRFSLKIMSEAGDVFAKVVFPVFSKIKNEKNRLKGAFFKTLLLISLVFGIITIGLLFYSSEFISITLGEKWLIAKEPLKIFAILGFFTVLVSIVTSLFLALGKQNITAKVIIARLTIFVVLLFFQQDKLDVVSISLLSLISFLTIVPLVLMSLIKIFR